MARGRGIIFLLLHTSELTPRDSIPGVDGDSLFEGVLRVIPIFLLFFLAPLFVGLSSGSRSGCAGGTDSQALDLVHAVQNDATDVIALPHGDLRGQGHYVGGESGEGSLQVAFFQITIAAGANAVPRSIRVSESGGIRVDGASDFKTEVAVRVGVSLRVPLAATVALDGSRLS